MKFTLAIGFILAANFAWGSTSFCSASPTYTELSSYGSGTGDGCYAADMTFSNFTGLLSGLSDVYVAGAESGYTNGLGAYDVSARFTGSAAGGAWTEGVGDSASDEFSFVADSADTYGFDSTYPTLPTVSLITTITLSAAGGVTTDGIAQVAEEICIGAAACYIGAPNSIELSGGFFGTTYVGDCNIIGQVTGATCAQNESMVTFSVPVTTVAVTASYSVVSPSQTGTASLDYFEDTFGEEGIAPEPSTFVLLGSALAALAVLRMRKVSGKRAR